MMYYVEPEVGNAQGTLDFVPQTCQYGQSTAPDYSDAPPINGKTSPALKNLLAQEGIKELKHLLQKRGIRTLEAFYSLPGTEREVLINRARLQYELLDIFPSHLNNTLNKLFGGNMPQQGIYWSQQWSLTPPLADDTLLKRKLETKLWACKDIVGFERWQECLRCLKRSDELSEASCSKAAEALAALGIRKEQVRDRERKETWKAARLAVRDVILLRCIGRVLGLDSREALVRAFEAAVQHTLCDENSVSQLSNGFNNLMETIRGARHPKSDTEPNPVGKTQETAVATVSQAPAAATATAPSAAAGRQATSAAQTVTETEGQPRTVPELPSHPNGPNNSDLVLPRPVHPADLHSQGPVLLQDGRLTQRPSLPPASPDCSLQMTQMMEMMGAMASDLREVKSHVVKLHEDHAIEMQAMTSQLEEVKSQLGKLHQDHYMFRFKPDISYDLDEDEDDDEYSIIQ